MEKTAEQDPRVYFAAERTFLAWIRTGLGLIGVGFAVSRFGIFLRETRMSETHSPVRATGFSEFSGVGLAGLGILVILNSIFSHIRLVHELSSGTWAPGRVSKNAVLLALVLALMGIAMACYLVVAH
jgi:putative membrane protein